MCSLPLETSFPKAVDAKKREVMYYITKTSPCTCFFFVVESFEVFLAPPLLHLSNMPTSFWDKVPVLIDKTECEGSSTFGKGL